MYNYEHEIPKTRNSLINKYLWNDYFHDSIMKDFRIDLQKKEIILTLSCEREWIQTISHEEALNSEEYDYRLVFSECIYHVFHIDKSINRIEFLNWRFKNSAILKKLTNGRRKKYYHLRMQLFWGYLDIIFHDFLIQKVIGISSIPNYFKFSNHFEEVSKIYSKKSINDIISLARDWDFPEKSEALDYLWFNKYQEIKDLAILNLADEDAWISAVFILWEIWDISDIPYLQEKLKMFDEYLPEYREMPILHINDALEKIFYRTIV